MHTSELNNFIIKFCKLWQAGVTANLHVETRARMAWCQVRAKLGHAPIPADCRPLSQRQPGLRRRGPAHKRRRAVARTAAAAVQAAASENVAKEVTGSLTEQVAKVLTKQVVA